MFFEGREDVLARRREVSRNPKASAAREGEMAEWLKAVAC